MSFATTHFPGFMVNSLLLPASEIISALLLIKTATSATFVVMIQGSSCLYAGPEYNTPP